MIKMNVNEIEFGVLTLWAFQLNKRAVRLRLSSEPAEDRQRHINMGPFFTLVSSNNNLFYSRITSGMLGPFTRARSITFLNAKFIIIEQWW
jgi:hypothetical protein